MLFVTLVSYVSLTLIGSFINTIAYTPSHLYNTLEQKNIAVVVVVVVAILS